MRQKLGDKKHKLCEAITGKKYSSCLVRGNSGHYVAICNYNDGYDWDYVYIQNKRMAIK